MADRLNITRRDFLNGVALATVAGSSLAPFEQLAANWRAPYPPRLTGLRGSHPGSFEAAHAVAWDGFRFDIPERLTDDVYDCVVVGGGISGLAAAWYFMQAEPKAKVLVLDNHDDFGGHAKRNEFEVDGKTLIGYGGSQSIDGPATYSREARQLLVDLGIDTQRFYDYFDRQYFDERNLTEGMYFSAAKYGRDATLPSVLRWGWHAGDAPVIDRYPLAPADREALRRLLTNEEDLLPSMPEGEKIGWLRATSYRDFLLGPAGMPESVYLLLRDSSKGLWGIGWDALSTLEAWNLGMPGTGHLAFDAATLETHEREEPYIFHFPDGNAGVARALVRELVPDALAGRSMEDLVSERLRYSRLDLRDNACRIRLDSTAVDVRHSNDGRHVDVTYVKHGQPSRVRARHAIMACYNNILPHICPEMPGVQAEAIGYAEKVPLVYISVAVRNWRAFANLGYHQVRVPQPDLMHSFGMDFPVSIGDYRYTQSPDEPTVLHGTYVPTVPDQGLTARQQHRLGRARLYQMTLDDFETGIVADLQGALGPGGFDAERDIAAITVNRWPHGYAYEYNDYSDPADYGPDKGPHIAGRARMGRISIANSDASAFAYVNGAIDAAYRAVREQLGDT